MSNKIKTYKEFYTFYLTEHSNKVCRILHVIGAIFVLALILTSIIHLNPYWLIFLPFVGYGFSWVGHFFFEKNVPATFTYPYWSLISDFKMCFDILTGRISLDASKDDV